MEDISVPLCLCGELNGPGAVGEQAAIQAKSLAANERYTRVDVVNRTCEKFEFDLGSWTAKFVPDEEKSYNPVYPENRLWELFASGDREVFARVVDHKFTCMSDVSIYNYINEYSSEIDVAWYNSHYDIFISTLQELKAEGLASSYRSRSFGRLRAFLGEVETCFRELEVE